MIAAGAFEQCDVVPLRLPSADKWQLHNDLLVLLFDLQKSKPAPRDH